jgi:NAD(P)-dependent dehydrogenase (short-subunit alcohol dehydrogenase family)
MDVSVTGTVVVVAGGTGGLGEAVSLAFLENGATVIVTYRKEAEFQSLRMAAGEKGANLQGKIVDVTDAGAVDALIGGVLAEHGRVDSLVNAVGGYAGGVTLWQQEPEVFDRMFELNLRPGYWLARAVVPGMLKQGHGAIVNVSAKAALDHGGGAGGYAASKAAALAMMDSLAADVKGSGVRVNSILPSIMDTAANRASMPDANFAAWPKTQDIAKVILFLCSDAGKVIHGAAVPVYGDS